ncbi:MAG: hypothetical protein HC862_20380 [Scytonema sp. RU_4_4]|nr:hypothetical protein [Scytonema sp. RU_4_4]
MDGFPGLLAQRLRQERRVAFDVRKPNTKRLLLGCATLKRQTPTEGNPPAALAPQPTLSLTEPYWCMNISIIRGKVPKGYSNDIQWRG